MEIVLVNKSAKFFVLLTRRSVLPSAVQVPAVTRTEVAPTNDNTVTRTADHHVTPGVDHSQARASRPGEHLLTADDAKYNITHPDVGATRVGTDGGNAAIGPEAEIGEKLARRGCTRRLLAVVHRDTTSRANRRRAGRPVPLTLTLYATARLLQRMYAPGSHARKHSLSPEFMGHLHGRVDGGGVGEKGEAGGGGAPPEARVGPGGEGGGGREACVWGGEFVALRGESEGEGRRGELRVRSERGCKRPIERFVFTRRGGRGEKRARVELERLDAPRLVEAPRQRGLGESVTIKREARLPRAPWSPTTCAAGIRAPRGRMEKPLRGVDAWG